MSFPRHERSIIRWGSCLGGTAPVPPEALTVWMSRSRLFLGELLSSRAHLRFTG